MKPHCLVSLKLPEDLIAVIKGTAHSQACSPAEVIRTALAAAFLNRLAQDAPGRTDLAAVAAAFAAARGWLDLQTRLRASGFVLRLLQGDLVLHEWPSDRALMPVEALGQSLPQLCLRFRAAFPGAIPFRPRTSEARPHGAARPHGL